MLNINLGSVRILKRSKKGQTVKKQNNYYLTN